MTRASARPRRCSSTMPAATASRSASRGYSTPTDPGCGRRTAGSCRISSSRRCGARHITIYGGGSQTRSFCYVDDLVEGLLRLMDCPAAADAPVNLGNPGEFTVAELAGDRAGHDRLAVAPDRSADAGRRSAPAQARHQPARTELLGWKPTVPLRCRPRERTIAVLRCAAQPPRRRAGRRLR